MWRNDELPEPETFTPERIAEFHLNNALDEDDYRWAVQEVIAMGIDPLSLNPDHLAHQEPWQNPSLYLDHSTSRSGR